MEPADETNAVGGKGRHGGWRGLGRALGSRNYRLFFAGQGVSLVGTWMTRLATSWLVFRLAGVQSAWLLGLVGFAGQAPSFFLAPFAGALVDRWDRRRVLVVTQVFSLLQSAALAAVAFVAGPGTGTITVVTFLALAQGLINAFDMPARQAFLVQMVDRPEDLPNAIALNSSLVNGARLVGPSLAGAIIAVAGEAWCFTLDAFSYVAVILALLAMHVAPRAAPPAHPPLWRGVAEGFRYAFGFPPIRALLLLLALVSFMGMPYSVLMPIFAADVLHGGPSTLGLLSGAAGVGALAGALFLASRQSVLGLGRVIVLATMVFGIGLLVFAWSGHLALSLASLVVAGFGMMVQMAASNTILQTLADEDKRGRVMSFYTMAFLGMAPFGSLFAGALAGRLGAAGTVALGGAACLAGAGLFALGLPRLRRQARVVYVRKGVLPEVAEGMQAATQLLGPPQQ